MKTFSIIVIVFALGFFGWFGFENKMIQNKEPEKNIQKSKNSKSIELKIALAENYCSQLELKIQKKQAEITNENKK